MSGEYTPTTSEVRNNAAFGATISGIALREGEGSEMLDAARDPNWPAPGVRDKYKEAFDA